MSAPLRDGAFLRLMAVTVLVFGGFTLLLPVVPLRTAELGGGSVVAGAATAVFMATTVATQLRVPHLLRVRGHRWVLVGGAVLLGAPALALPLVTSPAGVLAATGVRGCGFGMVTVAGGALIAELVPLAALGRAFSAYGVAVGVPQLVTLPVGLAVVDRAGTTPVLVAGGVVPLLAVALAVQLPGHTRPAAAPVRPPRLPAAGVARPLAALAVAAVSFGATLTFLPLALPQQPTAAGLALAVLTGAMLVGRGVAGPLADRMGGAGRLLTAGTLLAAAGAGLLAAAVGTGSVPALLAGAAVFGAAFGLVQNDSLVALFALAGAARRGPASAVWNVAYDAGTGAGAVLLGVVVALGGYPAAFAVTAGVVGVVGLLGTRRRRAPTDLVVGGGLSQRPSGD